MAQSTYVSYVICFFFGHSYISNLFENGLFISFQFRNCKLTLPNDNLSGVHLESRAYICGIYPVTCYCVLVPFAPDCQGAFNDFNQLVCGERVADNAQYIIPELNFSCNGTVTQWKVGLEDGGNGQSVSLQIWRSVDAEEYTSVTEVVYTKTVADEEIVSVPVSMSVMAGDRVGFYVPDGQLQPHTLPDVGLTMYIAGGSPMPSLKSPGSTVGPSPYISVVFGELFKHRC